MHQPPAPSFSCKVCRRSGLRGVRSRSGFENFECGFKGGLEPPFFIDAPSSCFRTPWGPAFAAARVNPARLIPFPSCHIPLREISDRPKKMSGRWGFRPLWRGGWRVYNQKLSPADPIGPLRSRAATRRTGANTLSPCLPPSAKLNFRLPFHPAGPPLPRR